jgi:hypothetical protein
MGSRQLTLWRAVTPLRGLPAPALRPPRRAFGFIMWRSWRNTALANTKLEPHVF